MRAIRIVLIVLLAIGLTGCKRSSDVQQAKALIEEGTKLVAQDSNNIDEWLSIYSKAFNPESRAKFPGNREWLHTQADRMIPLLDESSRLNNAAAEKFEQARQVAANDQQRKFIAFSISTMRKSVQLNELFKAQVRLVSDKEIKDRKSFEEKFLNLAEQCRQKQRELNSDYDWLKKALAKA